MRIIPPMSRLLCLRLSIFAITAALITSCGGNPPPRPQGGPGSRPAPVGQPVRVAAIPQTPPPQVAESVIVIDAPTGRVLYAKNADSPRPVASTQKILTALCVLDAGNVDQPITVTASDLACEPTRLNMKPGDVYSRRELLKVLMVKSANDVARSLARDVGGSQEGFADLMNRKAAELGMRNSHFINPNGLPQIGSFAATRSMNFEFNDGRTRFLENTNRLLKTVPYCDGLKTGTTNAAGRCLIASGSLDGRSAIVVVLKSTTPHIWSDSSKLLAWALERPTTASN
jgi:D-alanyl-D-alanine carboxypeptidase (penicillin-binding protein 5/6)